MAARRAQAQDIISLLESAGAQAHYTLFSAAWEGNAGEVERQLQTPGVDVNWADDEERTLLFHASGNGNAEVVALLLGVPEIDVNRADKYDTTPLSEASYVGHSEVVKLLLGAPGIDVNLGGKSAGAPLYRACSKGHCEVVELLLGAPGVDVNWANKLGRTALHIAGGYHMLFQCYPEAVKLLLGAPGIDVNLADYEGKTPLIGACEAGYIDVVALLALVPGVRVFSRDAKGMSALDHLQEHEDYRLSSRGINMSGILALEEVVVIKETFGSLVLALACCGVPRAEASDLAMHGLPTAQRRCAEAMRDAWA